MPLDAPTLFFVTIVVMAMISLLLLWVWLHNQSVKTLAWWSGALLLEAIGTTLVLLRGRIPDALSIDLANALLIAACGLIWSGARIFSHRTVHPSFALGAAIWLAACQFDAFYSSLPARASLFSVLIGGYALLTAWEFWRETEPLASRPAIIACQILNALVFFAHSPVLMLSAAPGGAQPLMGPWFTFIALQGTVHNIAAAFLFLAMAKERVELRYKTASRIDPLTGAFNRRSFVNSANQQMARMRLDDPPIALILFDLDHFKKINDRFGHPCGDEILKLFCSVASTHLRASDVFGRLGGEEFAALLPGTTAASAHLVASRILVAFETAGESLALAGMKTTASAGVAVSGVGCSSFDELFTVADRGLYKAKRAGRNRVREDETSFAPVPLRSTSA